MSLTEEQLSQLDISKHKVILRINEPQVPSGFGHTALDVEHNEQGEMVCIGLYEASNAYVYTSITSQLKEFLESANFVAHNGITDFELLREWGVNIKDEQLVWDTMLMGHIIDSSLKMYGLKAMAERELGVTYPSYDDIVGKKNAKVRVTLDQQPLQIVANYNALDCFVTEGLWFKQKEVIEKLGSLGILDNFYKLENPASHVFFEMEKRGVRLDLPYLNQLKQDLEEKRDAVMFEIRGQIGLEVNLNSPKQLLEALHALKIQPTLKGKPSTDKRALERFKTNSTVSALLRYSELDTLLSSFVYPYLERGAEVVRPHFRQCGTRTGRPSCSNPNLLQIPKRTENGKLVRRMFIPRSDMLMGDCDFGQIEPRVLAHLSKDESLLQLFNAGTDFHSFTSKRLFGSDDNESRNRAKILNLSVGYRATYVSVSAQLKCDKDTAQGEIDKWWSLFPALRRWQEKLIWESRKTGYFTTLMKRRIKVDDLNHGNQWRREGAERQLINNIAQASAAEVMKLGMIKIYNEYPYIGLLAQVYDELLFEDFEYRIEHSFKAVKSCMENAIKLDVPLVVDGSIGANWSDCK